MEDVVKNATTELISGQEITGVSTMKLKTILHSCTVSYIDIILYYYDAEHIIKQIDIEIRKRKDFYNFIATYGNSDVFDWAIESVDGIPYMVFDLKKLVTYDKPTTREELSEIINQTIEKEGNNCNLNFIDTSNITDMGCLFQESDFNGDISKWNVSNVTNMSYMFYESSFNKDITNWDLSNIEGLRNMFTPKIREKKMKPTTKRELAYIIQETINEKGLECDLNFIDTSLITDMSLLFYYSNFNGDISKWDVSNVEDMYDMFMCSEFNGDISKWDVSNVEDMYDMFMCSEFNGDISGWNVKNVKGMRKHMFYDCPLEEYPPEWY